MKKQRVQSYRLETSSLSSLRTVLTNARKAVPPRISKKDASDELALRLVQRMKTNYRKPLSAVKRTEDQAKASLVQCVETW